MKSYLGIIAGAVICLSACGDSDSGTKGSDNGNSATPENAYATEENLPGCIGKYEGEVAYVEEDNSAYKCEDGRWENKGEYLATSEDIKNCTVKREGTVAYIADKDESLVCRDGKWVKEDESGLDSEKSSSSASKGSDKAGESAEPAEGTSSSGEKGGSSSSDKSAVNSSSSSRDPDQVGDPAEPADGSSSSVQSSPSVQSSSSIVSNSSSSLLESSSSLTQPSSSVALSSSTGIVPPCKTETEDNCEYGVLKDSRDGKKYKTVKIGDQWWMAENLNFEYKVDGAAYGTYTNTDNGETYGRYYTWGAAMDSVGVYSTNSVGCGSEKTCIVITPARGICPEGWHIPDSTEWINLYSAMGKSPYVMQAKGYEKWSLATDSYGFTALPVGYLINGRFSDVGSDARFWSATEFYSCARYWDIYASTVYLTDDSKDRGFSVRCIKD